MSNPSSSSSSILANLPTGASLWEDTPPPPPLSSTTPDTLSSPPNTHSRSGSDMVVTQPLVIADYFVPLPNSTLAAHTSPYDQSPSSRRTHSRHLSYGELRARSTSPVIHDNDHRHLQHAHQTRLSAARSVPSTPARSAPPRRRRGSHDDSDSDDSTSALARRGSVRLSPLPLASSSLSLAYTSPSPPSTRLRARTGRGSAASAVVSPFAVASSAELTVRQTSYRQHKVRFTQAKQDRTHAVPSVAFRLVKYAAKLENALAKAQRRMLSLARESARVADAMTKGIEAAMRCTLYDKEQKLRLLKFAQEALLQNRLRQARLVTSLIQERLEEVEAALNRVSMHVFGNLPVSSSSTASTVSPPTSPVPVAVPPAIGVPDDFFVSPSRLAVGHPQKLALEAEEVQLKADAADAQQAVRAIDKKLASEEQPLDLERQVQIQSIVASAFDWYEGDLTGRYDAARDIELEFSRVLLDQRQHEGRTVAKWLALLDEKDPRAVPSSLVAGFIEQFIQGFFHEYEIKPRCFEIVRVLVQRILYPRVWHLCVASVQDELDRKDAHFLAQREWLRSLPQQDLGIEPMYTMQQQQQPSTSRRSEPFHPAQVVLEDLCQLVVPHDMLQCLLQCAQAIYRCAREYALSHNDPRGYDQIGGDSFFPILLYVLVHAQLPSVYRYLHMMKVYSTEHERMSESGYYLTCLESAIAYVETATPESVREHSKD